MSGPRLARLLSPRTQWQLLEPTIRKPLLVTTRIGLSSQRWADSINQRTIAQAPVLRQHQENGDVASETGASKSRHELNEDQHETKPSIFEELFPGEVLARKRDPGSADGTERKAQFRPARISSTEDEVPDEVRQWLQSEGEAAEEAQSGQAKTEFDKERRPYTPKNDWGGATKPAGKRETEPTVLVLSGTTPSLLPSDFFRIAPRVSAASRDDKGHDSSRLVDGWAASNGGIYKVVQDRDPTTLAPRGRYFLYFGSPAAALAYAQEVRDLHTLARRAAQPPRAGKSNSRRRIRRQHDERRPGGVAGIDLGDGDLAGDGDHFSTFAGSITSGGSGLVNDTSLVSTVTEEQVAALHSFSLVAPTIRLQLSMQMPATESEKKTTPSSSSSSSITLYDGEALDDAAASDATTKVLVVLELAGSSGSGGFSNYVDSDGRGVTTVEGLRGLIGDDGVRRNLPWGVSQGLNGVVPVRWIVDEQNRLLREAKLAARGRNGGLQDLKRQEDSKGGGKQKEAAASRYPPPALTALWASRVPDLTAKTSQMNESARFSRFVVAFSDTAEARRFVRSWHRRTVNVRQDNTSSSSKGTEGGHTVAAVVDATVLW